MPKFRITRTVPSQGMSAGTIQQRVVEIADGQPLPMGAEPVANATPTSEWEDAPQSPAPQEEE